MNDHFLYECTTRLAGILKIAGIVLTALAFAVVSPAQIKVPIIKNPGTIKKPEPTKPPTPADIGTGATREEVNSFLRDLRQFENERRQTGGGKGSGKGMRLLKNMATEIARNNFRGCGTDAAVLRMALDDGAAFEVIVRQKYPNIENPTWTTSSDMMVGDWRRAAENRNEIIKSCVTGKFAENLKADVEMLEQRLAKFRADPKAEDGFILVHNFDDPAALHASLVKRFEESFSVVGVQMPDDSVFDPYDAALKALVDEAEKHAGEWNWPGTFHDAMAERAARGWFAKDQPKGTLVKIGMMHSDWQVNKLSNGIPSGRYKRGYIMYKKPGVRSCIVVNFSYEQEYIGGGRYNEMSATSGIGYVPRLQSCG